MAKKKEDKDTKEEVPAVSHGTTNALSGLSGLREDDPIGAMGAGEHEGDQLPADADQVVHPEYMDDRSPTAEKPKDIGVEDNFGILHTDRKSKTNDNSPVVRVAANFRKEAYYDCASCGKRNEIEVPIGDSLTPHTCSCGQRHEVTCQN